MKEKSVAIYARVSTDKQAVDMQIRELKGYVKRKGWKLDKIYKDEAYSGSNGNRPGFKRMLDDAKRKKFDVLLFWKLDRLGRSLKDLVTTLDDLAAWGIDFVSYSDQHIDTTTPSGKLVFQIIGAVAEFERELIRERVKAGLKNAKRRGKRLGRKPLPPVLSEKVRELAGQGLSNRAIAKKLGVSEGTIRNRKKSILDFGSAP